MKQAINIRKKKLIVHNGQSRMVNQWSLVILLIAIINCQLSIVNSAFAQAPQAIPYQAVARDVSGNLIQNQNVSLRFSIHDATAAGSVVYQETQTATTNALGLFSVNIGQGTVVTGTFIGINWATNPKFTQVEIDVTGGVSYVDMGTTQLMSVPYALYAETSGSAGGSPWITNVNDIYNTNTGNVGIGTTTPEFKLSLDNDGGLMAKGTYGAGTTLTTAGAGTRMMWYPKKGAFRAGTVFGTQWDDTNLGAYSTAMGNSTTASGENSTALGVSTAASGISSTALGEGTIASGTNSTAFGISTEASAPYSTAMGNNTIASGDNSTAMGFSTTASGSASTALGNYVSTNSNAGSFIYGDNSTSSVTGSTTANQFMVRAAGGYVFYNDATLTVPNTMVFNNGKAGIGTITPEFKLSLDNDGGIMAKGTYGSGATLTAASSGARMFWYPKKSAFRAGYVNGSQWDDFFIGDYTTALGYSTTASGNYSTAIGYNTTASAVQSTAMGVSTIASGSISTAMGYNTIASGQASTAMGIATIASGGYSTAMGNNTTASGYYSTAMGNVSTATGYFSTAMGNSTLASGQSTTAMGYSTTASGDNSTAMGNFVSTNAFEGSFIIGDNIGAGATSSNANNQMTMRFNGGYRLFSNGALTAGVTLATGAGSWTSISDRNKKQNFTAIDNENILLKVAAMPISQWNYKAQATTVHHIGCMAQDFFAAFHLDGESDTTINTLDIDGINMAAIQALKVRTDELKKSNEELNAAVEELKNQKQSNSTMRDELHSLKAMLEKKGIIPQEVSASVNSTK